MMINTRSPQFSASYAFWGSGKDVSEARQLIETKNKEAQIETDFKKDWAVVHEEPPNLKEPVWTGLIVHTENKINPEVKAGLFETPLTTQTILEALKSDEFDTKTGELSGISKFIDLERTKRALDIFGLFGINRPWRDIVLEQVINPDSKKQPSISRLIDLEKIRKGFRFLEALNPHRPKGEQVLEHLLKPEAKKDLSVTEWVELERIKRSVDVLDAEDPLKTSWGEIVLKRTLDKLKTRTNH